MAASGALRSCAATPAKPCRSASRSRNSAIVAASLASAALRSVTSWNTATAPPWPAPLVGQDGADEVLPAQRHQDPATELATAARVGRSVDRGGQAERHLPKRCGQVAVDEQLIRVGDGDLAAAARLVHGLRRCRYLRGVDT